MICFPLQRLDEDSRHQHKGSIAGAKHNGADTTELQSLERGLLEGWALATCDFAENFLCRFQEEPQSAHWAYRQVTLFSVVVVFQVWLW